MCGILGLVAAPGTPVPPSALRALHRLRHRGPDDEGILFADLARGCLMPAGGSDSDPRLGLPNAAAHVGEAWGIVLGHRRLSIIDLSPAGHQPMSSADGLRWIVYNGEVYNYRELRAELTVLGHEFRSGSDTEVLLAGWTEWGTAMFPRLVGMFALAVLDIPARRLVLARDAFGIKPLYYRASEKGFAFASELPALGELTGGARLVNAQSLYWYLRFGISDVGDATLLEGMHQLPPAHWMEVDALSGRAVDPVRYWKIEVGRHVDLSFAGAASRFDELFTESVALHLRSDVPVGSCLSGGLDSSAIVHVMHSQLGGRTPLRTFTYVAGDAAINDAPFADLMVRATAAQPATVAVAPDDLARDLNSLMDAQGEPFASTSMYAQFRVFQLAREAGVTVLLDGQGSDEILGGYSSAASARLTSLLARGQVGAAWRLASAYRAASGRDWRRMVLGALGRLIPVSAVGGVLALIGEPLFARGMRAEWFLERGAQATPRPQGRGQDALREQLRGDIELASLPQLLRYEDRSAMAFSIETRVPFCVPALAEFSLALPEEYLVSPDGQTKAILRAAMRGRLPDTILSRPKVGFQTPEAEWLRGLRPWVRRTLDDADPDLFAFLSFGSVRDLAASQTDGALRGLLWRVLNIIHWMRRFDVSVS